MDIKKLIAQFPPEGQKKLAVAKNVQELSNIAEKLGHPLDAGEAEAVFAALYPVRGKESLSEEELDLVSAGTRPQSTALVYVDGLAALDDESREYMQNHNTHL